MSSYEAKQEAKRARLERAAGAARNEAGPADVRADGESYLRHSWDKNHPFPTFALSWYSDEDMNCEIDDVWERVCAGDEYPAGQCPDEGCGALCFLYREPKKPATVVIYVEGGLVQDVCTDAPVDDQPRVIVLDFDVEGSGYNPVPFDKHSTSFRSLCLAVDRAPMTVDQAYVADALDACARFEQANPEDAP